MPTERISVSREAGVGKVSEGRVEVGPWGSPEDQNWPFRGLEKRWALQTPLRSAVVRSILSMGQKVHNGNTGLNQQFICSATPTLPLLTARLSKLHAGDPQ
jgi:hypothetical protein